MIYKARLTEVKMLETSLTYEYARHFIEEKLGVAFNEDEDEIDFALSDACYYDGIINIDELLRKLNELKQDCGITHVEVLHHNDHGCYEITGFNLEVNLASDEEIERQRFEKEKADNIAKLQAELYRLQKTTYDNPTGADNIEDDDLPF